MNRIYATTSLEISQHEITNLSRSRRIAAEGMVLLKNNGILPMELKGRKIALFGNGARHTVPGGSGSGEVNARNVCSVEQGLEHAGACIMTKAWLDRYDAVAERDRKAYMQEMKQKYASTPELAFWAMFAHRNPLTVPVEENDFARGDGDMAIYILARNSGEGSDRRDAAGDYQLQQDEKDFLSVLCRHYGHVIVVLNVGGVIDTAFLRDQPEIDAILLMGQAGSAGGDALADVLGGKVSPCGHLAATWAMRYEDYPNAGTFGYRNGNRDDEYYTEGIYVGYRWFDSFGKTPAYPFGYGMSYTSFSIETIDTTVQESEVTVTLRVTNTGEKYSGREVVQLYVSSPEGRLDKPYQELVAYAKTKKLKPGQSEDVAVSFSIDQMASYDEETAAWIWEKGSYIIRAGEHSRATKIAAVIRLKKESICRKLENVLPLDCEMACIRATRSLYYSYPEEESELEEAQVISIEEFQIEEGENGLQKSQTEPEKQMPETDILYVMDDAISGKCSFRDIIKQLTVEEMTALCVGTARGGEEESSTIGAASMTCPGAAGETTSALLESRNIRNIILADGPAGLRLSPSFVVDGSRNILYQEPALGRGFMDILRDIEKKPLPEDAVTHYQYCTGIPTATLLAQTWDEEAVREAGDIIGSEMEEFGITLWLAPGMNIQRNPLCGRNFEYYSEDPVVSGICAAAETLGVQSHPGRGTTIKHFACNNLEDNRAYNNSHVAERTLREIYLKGFEIAVRDAQPMAVMSAYNMINGIHAANSVDLLTKVLRDEWGFEGIVMTDWGTTAEAKPDLEGRLPLYGCSSAAACIKAGNDLIMPGSREDVEEIIASVDAAEGTVKCPVKVEELRTCAERVLRMIAKSNVCPGRSL